MAIPEIPNLLELTETQGVQNLQEVQHLKGAQKSKLREMFKEMNLHELQVQDKLLNQEGIHKEAKEAQEETEDS